MTATHAAMMKSQELQLESWDLASDAFQSRRFLFLFCFFSVFVSFVWVGLVCWNGWLIGRFAQEWLDSSSSFREAQAYQREHEE